MLARVNSQINGIPYVKFGTTMGFACHIQNVMQDQFRTVTFEPIRALWMDVKKQTAQALLLHVGVRGLLGSLDDLHVGYCIHMCRTDVSCDWCMLVLDQWNCDVTLWDLHCCICIAINCEGYCLKLLICWNVWLFLSVSGLSK